MEALWLKSQRISLQEICRLDYISEPTLCSYLKAYKQGGIEKLKEINFYQPQSELVKHTPTIEAYFHSIPPTCAKEAMAKIFDLTKIKRSETQTRWFENLLG